MTGLKCRIERWGARLYSGGRDKEYQGSKPASGKIDSYHEKIHHKKGLVMAQAYECLLSKCEALSSNPALPRKKKKVWEQSGYGIGK
jgi:hypothetical protein